MEASFARLGPRAPVSLHGGRGFQIGARLHRGAILVSLAGIYDWSLAGSMLDEAGLLAFLDERPAARGDFLLLGLGPKMGLPPAGFTSQIERRGLGFEAMDTAAACRTYNILLAENRNFTAALLPNAA